MNTLERTSTAVTLAGMKFEAETVWRALNMMLALCREQQYEIDALKSHTHPKPIELMRF